jgi:hypothetical protein
MQLFTWFIVSAGVLFVLIGFRSLELAIGRDIIPVRVRDAVDGKVVRVMGVVRRGARKARAAIKHELRQVPIFILHGLVVIWAWALKQTLKAITLVHIRGDGRTQGTLATHLESVRAYEKQLRA